MEAVLFCAHMHNMREASMRINMRIMRIGLFFMRLGALMSAPFYAHNLCAFWQWAHHGRTILQLLFPRAMLALTSFLKIVNKIQVFQRQIKIKIQFEKDQSKLRFNWQKKVKSGRGKKKEHFQPIKMLCAQHGRSQFYAYNAFFIRITNFYTHKTG